MNLNAIDENTRVLFREELPEYRTNIGGYSLVKNETADLFSTMIGIMLQETLEGKSTPIIF